MGAIQNRDPLDELKLRAPSTLLSKAILIPLNSIISPDLTTIVTISFNETSFPEFDVNSEFFEVTLKLPTVLLQHHLFCFFQSFYFFHHKNKNENKVIHE